VQVLVVLVILRQALLRRRHHYSCWHNFFAINEFEKGLEDDWDGLVGE